MGKPTANKNPGGVRLVITILQMGGVFSPSKQTPISGGVVACRKYSAIDWLVNVGFW